MYWKLAATFLLLVLANTNAGHPNYAIVVSIATAEDAEWNKVVAALDSKHHAEVVKVDSLDDALPRLREWHPKHTCFVATPAEATREYVAKVHQLTRQYDDDPYTDTLWGILTGFDAANALTLSLIHI